jgi:quercetin dioxygenase-like cupin family protein
VRRRRRAGATVVVRQRLGGALANLAERAPYARAYGASNRPKGTIAMATLISEEIETNYIGAEDLPWVPFTPFTDQVQLKYFKIDPVRGEVVMSMRMPAGMTLPTHYHTGIVILYTVSGAWRYIEHDWIARAGDPVYETAGSAHAPEALEDSEIFLILVGELLFLDDDGQIIAQENWKTSAARYRSYCEEHGLEPKAITSFTA